MDFFTKLHSHAGQQNTKNVVASCACELVLLDCVWNVMAHARKPDFVFRRNGRFHLNRQGRQFSRLLAAELCASAVVMLDTPCSEVVWSVLATHSIRQFPLNLPSRTSSCAITFQLDSTVCWSHAETWLDSCYELNTWLMASSGNLQPR